MNKSRQQIYKDILASQLLALNVGPRGQKLPDWPPDQVKQQLTQAVLQEVEASAAGRPAARCPNRSKIWPDAPVNAVTPGLIDEVAKAVFNVLGVRTH